MAQVPYTPYSTAEPTTGGEKVSVSTPGAAFGENIAQAVQGLGSTVEKVGDEIFSRAMALQDLRNETDARDAQSKYAEQASLLHAKYGALEGKEAADALPGYIKAQNDLRQQIRGTLNTAYAQRYYDRDTLPFMQRNVFSAAGHAADQNKAYVLKTAEAVKYTAAKSFVNPENDDEFDEKVEHTKAANETAIHTQGLGKESLDAQNAKDVAQLWESRVTQLALTDPQKALQMLDAHQQELGDRYKQAVVAVRAQNRSVGTTKLVDTIYSPDKSDAEMVEEVKKASVGLAHGDPLFEKDALNALKSKVINQRFVDKQDQDTAMQKIYEGIQKLQPGEGINELRLQPDMAKTIDSLPPKAHAMIPGLVTSMADKRDKQGREDRFTELWGLSYSDREKFLDTDFSKDNLSNAQINRLITRRAAVIKDPNDDPHLERSLGWMKINRAAELRALGIFNKPKESDSDETKANYDHYVGAMQSAIDAWRQDNGKPPSYKDVTETIGPSIIRQRTEGGYFGTSIGATTRGAFDVDMKTVKEWADKKGLVQQLIDQGNAAPTDEELYRAYVRSQFLELYSKDKSSGGSAVPQSK